MRFILIFCSLFAGVASSATIPTPEMAPGCDTLLSSIVAYSNPQALEIHDKLLKDFNYVPVHCESDRYIYFDYRGRRNVVDCRLLHSIAGRYVQMAGHSLSRELLGTAFSRAAIIPELFEIAKDMATRLSPLN